MSKDEEFEAKISSLSSRADALTSLTLNTDKLAIAATRFDLLIITQSLGAAMAKILTGTTMLSNNNHDAAKQEFVEATGAMLDLADRMQWLFGNIEVSPDERG